MMSALSYNLLQLWMETLKKIKKFISKKKYYLIAGVCALGGAYLIYNGLITSASSIPKQTTLSSFVSGVGSGTIQSVELKGETVVFNTGGDKFFANLEGLSKDFVVNMLLENNVTNFKLLSEPYFISADVLSIIVSAATICVSFYLMRDNIMPKKTSKTNKLPSKPLQFQDIYGHEAVKQKLKQIIDFIHHPKKYQAVGARMRRGVLLYGPPGTGKTMIAKATAFEAGIDFIYISASQFIELFVGVGPKRIRELFQQARKKPKGCIIFIDEFDAIGSRSQSPLNQESERNSTINQLLTEMDGFNSSTNIVVIGATNREYMIDPAILRPGRLDVKIKVDLPNLEQRRGIMKVHLKEKSNSLIENDIESLAQKTDNYSGAQLQQIINQSAYICLRHGKNSISSKHLEEAYQEIAIRR